MSDQFERLKAALAERYSLERELGSGMATVYLAEHLKHHRNVAVKVLRPELAAVLGGERFLKEEGEFLRDKLERERQLGIDETVEIARTVASALDFAHKKGVVHHWKAGKARTRNRRSRRACVPLPPLRCRL